MTRILIILLFLIWLSHSSVAGPGSKVDWGLASLIVAGFALIVLLLGVWSRVLTRLVRRTSLHRALHRFHRGLTLARVSVLGWFIVSLAFLGYADVVNHLTAGLRGWPVELPRFLAAILLPVLAWAGLWWAQYPADCVIRESNLLANFEDDLPIHGPPPLGAYFVANLRQQILFTAAPVLLILLLRDLATLTLWWTSAVEFRTGSRGQPTLLAGSELLVSFCSALIVLVVSPLLLRRILPTESLPQGDLRRRLERLCSEAGLRHRDILLWKTNNTMGNAAVMGVLPQVRYILLSDVLLETMTDRQIEAVFAHEIGHVAHRHMGWYVLLVALLMLLLAGPGEWIESVLARTRLAEVIPMDSVLAGASVLGFVVAFGALSRRFERQADVYAARAMSEGGGFSPEGVATFTSALARVSVVNNIPPAARNFSHGSIRSRIHFLRECLRDPGLALRFDRRMMLLGAGMIVSVVVLGVWLLISYLR